MSERDLPLPPLNALRSFEAAGRHLSFRAAGDELGVTQGAVAQQVRGLETRLGLKLFERLPRGLALTETGRGYHADIARAFDLITEATAVLTPQVATVTIAVTPTFAAKWLIPHLAEFSRACPDIELRIAASDRVASFHGDGIDIAVRQGRPPFGASLIVDLLIEPKLIAVCHPSLVGHLQRPTTVEALASFVLLHDAHNYWPRYVEHAFGSGHGFAGKGPRFSQTSLAIDAAIAGQGVALASDFLVERDLAEGRLVQLLETVLEGTQPYYVLSPRGTRGTAAVARVRQWLLTSCQREA